MIFTLYFGSKDQLDFDLDEISIIYHFGFTEISLSIQQKCGSRLREISISRLLVNINNESNSFLLLLLQPPPFEQLWESGFP